MPRGDKSAYTDKQKRQAEHIEERYEKRGVSNNEAEKRAWATVNKMTEGVKRAGQVAVTRSIPTRPEQAGKRVAPQPLPVRRLSVRRQRRKPLAHVPSMPKH